jgi:opacity protein-like surface antigen
MIKYIKRTSCATLVVGLFIAGIAAPERAFAENVTVEPGFFIAGSVGGNFQRDDPLRVTSPTGKSRIKTDFKDDVGFTVAIGYQYDKALVSFLQFLKPRLELEYNFARAELRGASGRVRTDYFKGLLYSDIRWSQDQKIVPYFGTGVGIGRVDAELRGISPNAGAPTIAINDSSSRFSTHSSLGLTFKATEGLDIYAEGRYSRTLGVKLDAVDAVGTPLRIKSKAQAFGLGLGARARF